MSDFTMRRLRAEELPGLTGVDPSLIEDRRKWRVVNTLVGLGFSWVAERDERPIGYSVASRYFYDYPFIDLLVPLGLDSRGGSHKRISLDTQVPREDRRQRA